MTYQMTFDEKKCTGCYACHTACIAAHPACETLDKSLRAIKTVIYEGEGFQKNVCPGCIHCGACERVCPFHAIYRDAASGFILADPQACTGCRDCAGKCPVQVIRFDLNGKILKCDGCIDFVNEGREPACVRNCYAGAITVRER